MTKCAQGSQHFNFHTSLSRLIIDNRIAGPKELVLFFDSKFQLNQSPQISAGVTSFPLCCHLYQQVK